MRPGLLSRASGRNRYSTRERPDTTSPTGALLNCRATQLGFNRSFNSTERQGSISSCTHPKSCPLQATPLSESETVSGSGTTDTLNSPVLVDDDADDAMGKDDEAVPEASGSKLPALSGPYQVRLDILMIDIITPMHARHFSGCD